MKMRPFVEYFAAKVKATRLRENYLYDCLWAMATDMRFISEKEPSMKRWHEVAYPKKPEEPLITKESVKRQFVMLKRKIS